MVAMNRLKSGVIPVVLAALFVLAVACEGEDGGEEQELEPTPTSTSEVVDAPQPTNTPMPTGGDSDEDAGGSSLTLPLFSAESPFNTAIGSDPAIDDQSDLLLQTLVRDATVGFVVSVKEFSSPIYVTDQSTPRYDVNIRCGAEWEVGVHTLKGVPIPDGAEPAAAAGTENPDTCGGGELDGDYHLVVIDPVAGCQYELWQAKKTDGSWAASWGNAISTESSGIYPYGMSSRGSGIAFAAGVIWPEELASGRIQHALAFNSSSVKSGGPVAPATDSDGAIDRDDAIPEGARVQLDPSLDLDSLDLTDYERTIARALQEYGMFLVDSGGEDGGMALYAVDPKSVDGNPYEGIWPDEDYVSIGNIPADHFRVLEMGPQESDPELAPEPNACTSWE